ncbi:MAG: transglycosylase domain-containing protein [Erysipelotrichaceae bacterium]|nr:transglycosylase domain-containing protein [Erysipelotrichaceae bacterium]
MKKKLKESNSHETQPKKKYSGWKIFRIIFASCMILGFIAAGVIGYKFYEYAANVIANAPEMTIEDFQSAESSKILDKDGNVVDEIGLYLRENITYEDLPQSLVDAVISIEDSRFFIHNGFDLPRFTKAAMEIAKDLLTTGKLVFSQGGSTTTMQLVKNTYFSVDAGDNSTIAEKSIDRKIQEIYLAIQLEQQISKEDILELYLNKLNFGGNIRGVQKASEYYFGKHVSELSLSESALIAGIINKPNGFNPYNKLQEATERRNTVLDMMEYHGYITKEEASLAKSINIEDQLVGEKAMEVRDTDHAYQSYIDAVIEEVIQLTGKDPATTPMTIYTFLDTKIQSKMDSISNDEFIDFDNELLQMSMVCMDNSNGHIVALSGGRNYTEGERLFNRATSMFQQPGSSVKPFLSYALAFDRLGWATSHIVTDRPFLYRGTTKVVKNFDGRYRGDMTLWDAVGTSMNTPALQTLQDVIDEIGRSEVIEYMNDLGFTQVNTNNFDLGYAIGGSSYTATPVQMTAAHATMINYGRYNTPHTVDKIVFADGNVYQSESEQKQVLDEGAAYLASQLMENDVTGPYVNYMQILKSKYEVYAKTGTTDWGTDGGPYGIPTGAVKDKWMIASTSQYTTTLWLGFDKAVNKSEGQTWFPSSFNRQNYPGKIMRELLNTIHDDPDNYPKPLTQPDDVTEITHILGTFPYASTSGYEHLSTTGLILKKHKQLVNVHSTIPELKMNSMTVYTDEWGTTHLLWNADGFGATNEQGLKNISLSVDDIYVEAWGTQLFSYTWILGNPTYVAKVYVNGQFYQEISTEYPNYWLYLPEGSNVKACGYFRYPNGARSNEACNQ